MSAIDSIKAQVSSMTAAQKAMAIGAAAVILFGGGWILANVIPAFVGPPKATLPDSPAWRTARELNEKLLQDSGFLDVGLSVAADSQTRYDVNGAVYSQADMARLQDWLKEHLPSGDYNFNVEILKK